VSPPAPAWSQRRFFLAEEPRDARARLAPSDEEHARRVLRVRDGDEILGLDGKGGVWPLRVRRSDTRAFELDVLGPPAREPAAGEPGAALPWIEVAVSLPKGSRSEDLLEALVQLGAAAWTPLVCSRTEGAARELSPERLARLERVAREALKQSRRAWLPLLNPPSTPAELANAREGARLAVLSPTSRETLLEWALAPDARTHSISGSREAPIVLVVGPEGGLTAEESAHLAERGARSLALGPHVLRVETAATAALAVLACALFRRP